MTDRDHFAAAALTGLLSDEANQYPTALQWEHLLTHAYRWADAMLRERQRTDLDAAPAARACTDAAAGEPGGGAGAGNTQEPVAWLAHSDEWQMVSMHREHADAAATENGAEVVPLYRAPQT
jgi:hypothetical protein